MIYLFWLVVLLFAFTIFRKFAQGKDLGAAYYAILPFALPAIVVWLLAKGGVGSASLDNFEEGYKPLLFVAGAIAALIGLIQLLLQWKRIGDLKNAGVLLILGLFIGSVAGFSFQKMTKAWFTKDTSRDVSGVEAKYKLSAVDLTKEFVEDTSAIIQYQDGVMEISGTLESLEDDLTGEIRYFLKGHTEFNDILLYFSEDETSQDNFDTKMKSEVGKEVTLKGWCNGGDGEDVYFRDVLLDW